MDIRMLHSRNGKGLKDVIDMGYDGISRDLNQGRGGDFLYLILEEY